MCRTAGLGEAYAMPTRQDELHSYQFMMQRVVAAVVMRETDPPQSPFRRLAGATLASVLLAALALAAVAVYGVLSPGGGTGWHNGDAVIVERESGARYIYRDGKLHPVTNYASALLILGSAAPKRVFVSRSTLVDVPRGAPLGIPGAPDSLPDAGQLVGPPWTVCSRPESDGQGGSRASSVLLVGSGVDGRGLGEDGMLATSPDDARYLLWHNRRHLIREPGVVLPALGWGGERPVVVAPALLNALAAGGDLARLPIPDRGKRSARVPDARIGQVFVVASQGGGRQYAVALRDGLAGVTQVQADVLIGDPLTAELVGRSGATPLDSGQYALIPRLGELLPGGELAPPSTTPTLARPVSAVCVLARDAAGVTEARIDVTVRDAPHAVLSGSRTAAGAVLADRVFVPPGRGAVVEALASPQAPNGTLSVVTDLGMRYEVPGPDVLAMLGYRDVQPLRLPANLVALLPAGPALDPAAARSPVVAGN